MDGLVGSTRSLFRYPDYLTVMQYIVNERKTKDMIQSNRRGHAHRTERFPVHLVNPTSNKTRKIFNALNMPVIHRCFTTYIQKEKKYNSTGSESCFPLLFWTEKAQNIFVEC
jgi:hypothetical protein